jgi:hypothetical protein
MFLKGRLAHPISRLRLLDRAFLKGGPDAPMALPQVLLIKVVYPLIHQIYSAVSMNSVLFMPELRLTGMLEPQS